MKCNIVIVYVAIELYVRIKCNIANGSCSPNPDRHLRRLSYEKSLYFELNQYLDFNFKRNVGNARFLPNPELKSHSPEITFSEILAWLSEAWLAIDESGGGQSLET